LVTVDAATTAKLCAAPSDGAVAVCAQAGAAPQSSAANPAIATTRMN
jgi:hypothetical protein